jgi:hypothetical protein
VLTDDRKVTLLVALTLMLTPLSASALTCKPAKKGAGEWSYRIVDGKRCWYPGRARIAKSKLHWAKPKVIAVAGRSATRPPTNNIDPMYATGSDKTVERWANWLRSPWSKFPLHLEWGGW